jgi:hypothetical protein
MRQIMKWCVLAIVAVGVMAVGASSWQKWSQATSRAACIRNLKTIGVALHAYHDSNAHFPAAYSANQPPHSWRVALLPWMNEQSLFEKYDLNRPWDDGTNPAMLAMRPSAYACPEVTDPARTSYQAAVGLRTAWPYDTGIRIKEITDGTSNTVMLLDIHDPDVEWTRPSDHTLDQALYAVRAGQRHSPATTERGIQMLFADGSVRYVSSKIESNLLRGLMTPNYGSGLPPDRMSAEALQRAAQENVLPEPAAFQDPVDASLMKATRLSPAANAEIEPGKSLVYCPTMVLAWKRFVGDVPQIAPPPLAVQLLDSPFSESDISPSAVEISVGMSSNLGREVNCKLRKHLAFSAEFDPFKLPLTFVDTRGEHKVKAFGVTSHWEDFRSALAQVRVSDFRSPDDFVISIDNVNGEDLVLAKIPQPPTLQAGIDDVSARIRDSRIPTNARTVVGEEQVVIPVLELSLFADFRNELRDTASGSEGLVSAVQIVQFRLDERGAVVWSEAGVVGENGHYEYTPGTRTFIFDKPFLIMLREAPDKYPYLAAWIANTEMMTADSVEK